jgi:hypothetical protein
LIYAFTQSAEFHNCNPNLIGISYRGSTGLDNNARVQAALRRINGFNGSVSTVTGLEFDSNNEGETNYTFRTAFKSHTLDDFNLYYFIQVTLTRHSTSEIIEFGGVELTHVVV